jgi:hypothetical protein
LSILDEYQAKGNGGCMTYPEPSTADHGTDWNLVDVIDEAGNEKTVCGCDQCRREARKKWRDENDF